MLETIEDNKKHIEIKTELENFFSDENKTEKDKQKSRRDIAKGLGLITYLGVMMLTTVGVGVFIGIFLDKWLNTNFIFTLVFSFFGILAAFRNMYYQIMKK